MTYTLRRMLPNATTCEVSLTGAATPSDESIKILLNLLDETERQIKERLNGPQAPDR